MQLQQNFRVTPIYKEINDWDEDEGYHMGVYLSINCKAHQFKHNDALPIETFFSKYCIIINKNISILDNIKSYYEKIIEGGNNPVFVIFLADSKHKIKKKAEQCACKIAFETMMGK